jgi:hypothetical protein
VLDIRRAVEVDPFTDRVVVERARVGEFARLHVDRHAREEAVPAAVVEMQVGVDDAGDVAGDVLRVRVGLISSISGLESIIPVSTSTSPAGWSIVQTNTDQRSPSTTSSAARWARITCRRYTEGRRVRCGRSVPQLSSRDFGS